MLAPLALLRREGRRLASVLWGYVAYLFLTWWLLTHRLDRFWLPLLPALAVLAGLGADWTRGRAWSILLWVIFAVATVLNFTCVSTALTGLNEWTGDLNKLRIKVPAMLNPPLAPTRRRSSRPTPRVLLVGQAAVFHMNHPVVYNTVFNHETFETLARGRTPAEVGRALRERGITHVYVDWFEIERYRSPGNYGFTPFVTPEVFAEPGCRGRARTGPDDRRSGRNSTGFAEPVGGGIMAGRSVRDGEDAAVRRSLWLAR